MTYTIIGGDKKEYGPISSEDIRQWISEGRLNGQTLAKSVADSGWRTLASYPEFADVLGASAPPPIIAPAGAPPVTATDANWQAVVEARQPELRLGECLAAGWSFIGAHFGFLIGAVLLTWVFNAIFALLALFIPLIGALGYLCMSGIIFGGFYFACLRRMRGENVGPAEVFSGFRLSPGQLVLTSLVAGLLMEIGLCFCLIPGLYLGIAWALALPLVIDKGMFFWSAMELSRKVITKVWFEMFALVVIAFLPLIVVQAFGLFMSINYFIDQYHAANDNLQQFAQNMQGQTDTLRKLTFKSAVLGQIAFLVNFFYIGGVMMRAYENLFGTRKP